jgi:hypothetical protein
LLQISINEDQKRLNFKIASFFQIHIFQIINKQFCNPWNQSSFGQLNQKTVERSETKALNRSERCETRLSLKHNRQSKNINFETTPIKIIPNESIN